VRGPDEGGDLGGGGEGGSTSACRRRPEMDVLVGGTASCGEKGGLPRTPRESLEGGLSARKFTGRRSRSGETGANDNDGYTELTLTAAVWLRLVHFGVPLGTPSPVWRIDWPIRPLKRLAPPNAGREACTHSQQFTTLSLPPLAKSWPSARHLSPQT
jgi:hypothetical protein